MKTLLERLDEAGSTGADLSPGDPLFKEAADTIRALTKQESDFTIVIKWTCPDGTKKGFAVDLKEWPNREYEAIRGLLRRAELEIPPDFLIKEIT